MDAVDAADRLVRVDAANKNIGVNHEIIGSNKLEKIKKNKGGLEFQLQASLAKLPPYMEEIYIITLVLPYIKKGERVCKQSYYYYSWLAIDYHDSLFVVILTLILARCASEMCACLSFT